VVETSCSFSESTYYSDGLIIELFDRSKIIQLVIGRWIGQFGPDGEQASRTKNLARRMLLASRLNVPKTGWYFRPLFENSTAISVGAAKIGPIFPLDGLLNLGGRLAAAGDVVFSGTVSSNMLGRLIPDSGPNNHYHVSAISLSKSL